MFVFLTRFVLAVSLICFLVILLATLVLAPLFSAGVIAFSRYGGDIYLVDVAHKQERQITYFRDDNQQVGEQVAASPSFSPDGKQIAFVLGQYIDDNFVCGTVHIMDMNGGNIRLLNEKSVTGIPASWSPDGQSILYTDGCSFSGDISSVDVNTDEITEMHSVVGAQYPVWSPDGSRIAYITWSSDDGDIAIADLKSEQPPIIIDDDHNNFSPSWSPDGQQIVFFGGGETSGNLYIVDVATQKVRQLTNDTDVLNTEPRWSPNGQWIAFYSGSYYGGDINVIDIQGNNRFLLTKGAQNLSWQP